MPDQAWITVMAIDARVSPPDIFLTVSIDGNHVRPQLVRGDRAVRRSVLPGKHTVRVGAHMSRRYRNIQDATQQFQFEVPLDSDFLIAVKVRESKRSGMRKLLISEPHFRDPASHPLIPEQIWGYSKDRCIIIESPDEDEEPLSTDAPRIIDNPSAATVTRSIQVSKEWKRTHTIETEGSTKTGASIKLATSIGIETEAILSAKYGISIEDTLTYTENVSLSVPPHSKVTLRLAWKRRIKRGILRYFDEAGFALIDVPFSVMTGVTFDQETS